MAVLNKGSIFLDEIREAPWISIGAVLGFDFFNLFLFIIQAHPLTIVFMPWIFVVGIGVFALGKQRLSDIGITVQKILPGILITVGIWVAIQAAIAMAIIFDGGNLAWDSITAGNLIDQFLFFAIVEEITFRAFLFPQFLIKLKHMFKKPVYAFWAALLISQTLFSLYHIPQRIYSNTPASEIPFQLGLLLISGLFLCYIYLRSQNLWVAVGVHTLGNFPTTLFVHDQLPWYVVNLIVMFVSIVIIEWWRHTALEIAKSNAQK